MLHSILVISTSGIVLFHKEFTHGGSKSKQIGGIITAMMKFSVTKTGLPVAYIQMQNGTRTENKHTKADHGAEGQHTRPH
jgi:hypothetical protein